MRQGAVLLAITSAFSLWGGASACSAQGEAPPVELPLWQGEAPGSEAFDGAEQAVARGQGDRADRWVSGVSRPTISVYLPAASEAPTAAVVVCPGGGYAGLSYDKEGHFVAKWLRDRGVAAAVLKYRTGGGAHQHPVPLSDAVRAVRVVRDRADEWNVRPDAIGVMGFSAGGHLAATVGTRWEEGDAGDSDALQQTSARPDFLALIYPVISMEQGVTHGGSRRNLLGDSPSADAIDRLSADTSVTDQTPPALLIHAADDRAVPDENALRFYAACRAHGVPAELHVFEEGGHGFGMWREELPVGQWPELLAAWMRRHGWMP